ncbi:hypothetical protein M8818_003484 [Zalaria obscura]|uniref:Uncharacterized protein n=1 Tax=Zalaria obscura TaxID=2024903 RepID=A0ACC3SEQ6_9PEZI
MAPLSAYPPPLHLRLRPHLHPGSAATICCLQLEQGRVDAEEGFSHVVRADKIVYRSRMFPVLIWPQLVGSHFEVAITPVSCIEGPEGNICPLRPK